MNEKKIMLVNGLVTGILGTLLMSIMVMFVTQPLFGPRQPVEMTHYVAYAVTLLLIPMAIYTTRHFLNQKYKTVFKGLFFGGLFSTINGVIISSLIIMLTKMEEFFSMLPMITFYVIPFAFIIGAIAGAVIVTRSKKS